MTAPELSPAEAAKLARFESAPVPPEVLREQVARAMWEGASVGRGGAAPWDRAASYVHDFYRQIADAALAVIPQQGAAVQRGLSSFTTGEAEAEVAKRGLGTYDPFSFASEAARDQVRRVLAVADRFEAASKPDTISAFDRGVAATYAAAADVIRAAVVGGSDA